MDWIGDRLREVVIDRTFLGKMDPDEKRTILLDILRPTDETWNGSNNNESYFQHFIDCTMKVPSTCVRTHYSCECKVFYCGSTKRLKAKYRSTYRLYPSQKGYDDIRVGFSSEDTGQVLVDKITIKFSNGRERVLSSEAIMKLDPEKSSSGSLFYKVPISVMAREDPCIHVSVEWTQCGYDHWIQIALRVGQPTDGFHFSLTCQRPLVIKEDALFILDSDATKNPTRLRG
jgi:hypothetical protein